MALGFDEEIEEAVGDDDEQRREELEAWRQQQIIEQRQNQQASVQNTLKQQATQQIKQQIKKRVMMVVLEFLASTSPVWGPIVGVLLLVVMLIGFVVFLPTAALCGKSMATDVALASIPFNLGPAIQSIRGYACPTGTDSTGGSLSGSPETDDLDIILTSAYRPESNGSAHQRGEAVDIALRVQPTSNNDPRIAQLVALAESFGFKPPVGDTIDEWNRPQENTSAGHVHIEYNLKIRGNLSGGSYCDNSGPVLVPPTDLVDIPASIPRRDVSGPRAKVRACLLDEVIAIFEAAQSTVEP